VTVRKTCNFIQKTPKGADETPQGAGQTKAGIHGKANPVFSIALCFNLSIFSVLVNDMISH
jgi:hypothetical protein